MTASIKVDGLSKWYPPRPTPTRQFWRALKGQVFEQGGHGSYASPPRDALIALHPVSFSLEKGKVLGVIGKNGAGKSTLLQLLSGTLEPSAGSVQISGRVAALLELGAGFNPEYTGLENVHLNAALLGLSTEQIRERLDSILLFADIGDFVYRPVKTYSSGMFVRLAFAVAVCVEPEILIIDEALSVGDGQFARKSFQRIMDLKEAGTTILFCSHSLYQVEALCDEALWLDKGRLKQLGSPSDVIAAYTQFLESGQATAHPSYLGMSDPASRVEASETGVRQQAHSLPALGRILGVRAWFAGRAVDFSEESSRRLLVSGNDRRLELEVTFQASYQAKLATSDAVHVSSGALDVSNASLWEVPTVAVTLTTATGQCLSSVSTLGKPVIVLDEVGKGSVRLVVPNLPLRRGIFRVDALLGCARGLQLYDHGVGVLTLDARAEAVEQGLVEIDHFWVAK